MTNTPMSHDRVRIILRGGTVVDTSGERRADVVIEGTRITEVGDVTARAGDSVVDCTGRLVMPGFIDAHSHVDGLLGDEGVQRSLLRQGVTSVIVGQDGVSYAPGDGAYANEYFAAVNGPHPTYSGGGVASYLDAADGTSRVNAAYLVPAGTVRYEVCGRSQTPADDTQRAEMAALVDEGMSAGAVGLSTGLDYVPGIFQSTDEIAALCVPVADAGGVYVSHMRGGYEANSAEGIDEIAQIARLAGEVTGQPLQVHVSHFHAEADILLAQLDALAASGIDTTFDAYPYVRGCSLMGMPLLPPELSAQPVDDIVRALDDPAERDRLRRDWFPRVAGNPSLGPDWPRMISLSHLSAPELSWAHGLTIAQAAQRAGVDAIDFVLDTLRACRLQANIIMAVRHERPVAELARIFSHPAHIGGSDGIFIGAHPHPRARGSFAHFLRTYVRETGTWSWSDAVQHLSAAPAKRFGLGGRGAITPGAIADVIVVRPGVVADVATYEEPLRDSVGIDDVFVAGIAVLGDGELVTAFDKDLPGRGLRRAEPDHHPSRERNDI